jgi:hypothetical protein
MRTRLPRTPSALLSLSIVFAGSAAFAWTPLPVINDPLVRQPGSQENDGIVIESASNCMTCHSGYNAQIEPGSLWKSSMMGQTARDPIFWATVTVAAQDSIWAAGRPNATDICLRCHTPPGWLGGRSDPTNGSALAGTDFDGVTCDFCHSSYDPFHEGTFAGTREGNDWTGYWDETGASATPSLAAATATRTADRTQSATKRLFNGNPMYSAQWQPLQTGYTENASGQYFVSTDKNRRASFADANPKHSMFYSRLHKSKYFCGGCHDVSNPVLANIAYKNTQPGDGTTVLPTEQSPASSFMHVERTQSEFLLSGYGTAGGTDGVGPFAPTSFKTSHPNNRIGTCQDCHMNDGVGVACNKTSGVLRPTDSIEHPKSGLPLHSFTGGNALVPRLLASSVAGSPNYDATNATALRQGPAILTMDLTQGEALDAALLLAAADKAVAQVQMAASVQNVTYNAATGLLSFRLQNNTGHKLLTGYPEGRRLFANIKAYSGGTLAREINPFDTAALTMRGLDSSMSHSSPPLGANEVFRDELVFEDRPKSSLTGESHTLHFALATGRAKDNRIPPKGFRINEAAARLSEPVWNDAAAPDYFSPAEYAGGYDDITIVMPTGLDAMEVRLYYQSFTREYAEFLRDEIKGTSTVLTSPAPSGEAKAYVVQTDAFFARLRAWGDTIYQIWDHNRTMPGESPILMASGVWGNSTPPCSKPGSDGTPCSDGNACTTSDVCQAGVCKSGTAVVCTPLNACHAAGTCDSSTGQCSNPAVANGTPCTDSDACTLNDSCNAGSCTAGAAVVCSALDACHDPGTCNPATGQCSNPAKADGATCTDNNACTLNDTCNTGSCTAGAAVVCSALDACHDPGTCNPATGQCSNPAKADGATCDDSNACTQSDHCLAGACAPGTPVVCVASDECHVPGACNAQTGLCANPLAPDGKPCSAGQCSSGICVAVDADLPDSPAPDVVEPDVVEPDVVEPDVVENDVAQDQAEESGEQDAAAEAEPEAGEDTGAGGNDAAEDSNVVEAAAETGVDAADTGTKADAADAKQDAVDAKADAKADVLDSGSADAPDAKPKTDGAAGQAGAEAGADASPPEAPASGDDSGCSCTTTGRSRTPLAVAALLAALAVMTRRARRRG